MAGTLFGLGLMPQFDASGNLARGALLYIYQENTSTPVTTYSDFGLTSTQTWPIEADSAGRLPAFWLSDGNYRARLTTSAGVEIFDEQSITSIGASSGGSGGGSSQDTTTLFQTGHMLFDPIQSSIAGFVRANALTIGNGSSGATERANSDTQSLFEFLWTNYDNTACPVSTGRGATATADFNANKTIGTPDWRDCVAIGRSGMGNTSSALISDTAAAAVGATTATIVIGNLPTSGALNNGTSVHHGGTTANVAAGGDHTVIKNTSQSTLSIAGSDTPLSIIPKGRVGTWFIKL